MTYFEKYIKYKNKYINFKNKLGGAAAELTSADAIDNSIGTCWFHVILSLFTFGDKTKDDFHEFITIKQTDSDDPTSISLDEKILNRILHNSYGNNLYNFMKDNEVYKIKYEKSILQVKLALQNIYINNVINLLLALIKRYDNKSTVKNIEIDNKCEISLNTMYNQLFFRPSSKIGGSYYDRLNMSNLLSIIIYNKQTNIIIKTLQLINEEFITNFNNIDNYGIGLVIEEHIFSIFYRDKKYWYANNNILKPLVIKVVTTTKLEEFNDLNKLLVIINDLNQRNPYTLHLLKNEIILCIHNNSLSGGAAWTGSTPVFVQKALQETNAKLAAEEAKLAAEKALGTYNIYCSNINKSNIIEAIELYNFKSI